MPQSNFTEQREPEPPCSEAIPISVQSAIETDRGERLNSWKEISAYLRRDPRTTQRWEKSEGLPVHRHVHSKAGTVYAFASEIDAWQQSRARAVPLSDRGSVTTDPEFPRSRKRASFLTLSAFIATLATGVIYLAHTHTRAPVVLEPVPLSSLPVEQLSPSFSPDGDSVVFAVGNRSGKDFQIFVKPGAGGRERQISSGPVLNYSPAWSPDGKTIAYLSGNYGADASVWLVSPDGSNLRKFHDVHTGVWPWRRSLAWTPDSQALITTDTQTQADSTALFRLGLDGTKRRITRPPSLSTDSFPSVSADGKLLVFSRFGAGVAGLYQQRLDKDEQPPRLISTQLKEAVITSAVWLGPTRELLVGTERRGAGQLWRLSPSGKPVPLAYMSEAIVDVAASRNGDRAVFALRRTDTNMWTLPLPPPSGVANPIRDDAIISTREEYNGQYSPDGINIAFESNRSGSPEIWTSGLNGQNTRQITHFQGPVTGSPHWSPDGKWLVFDSRINGHAAIFVTSAKGDYARRITLDEGPNVVPSWSHGGKWIYFASGRKGRHEVWRVHPDGSDPTQLTHDGGFYAEDTPDGKTIYYTKERDAVTSLWRVDSAGSKEQQVAAPVLDRCFAVASRGVYFISASTPAAPPVLRFLPFGGKEAVVVTRLPHPIMYGLAISPEGRELLFAQLDTRAVELMLVKGPFQ